MEHSRKLHGILIEIKVDTSGVVLWCTGNKVAIIPYFTVVLLIKVIFLPSLEMATLVCKMSPEI